MEFIRTTLAEVVALSVPMPMHASLNGYEGCVWTSVEMRCFKDCEGAHESFFFFFYPGLHELGIHEMYVIYGCQNPCQPTAVCRLQPSSEQ